MKIIVDDILNAIAKLEEHVRLGIYVKILLIQDGTLGYILNIIDKDNRFNVIKQVEYDDHIDREVILRGKYIINASSIIYKDALSTEVLEDIKDKKIGIGKILRKHRLETFRNIIEIGYDNAPYRVYEIIHNKKVAFRIKEIISSSDVQ